MISILPNSLMSVVTMLMVRLYLLKNQQILKIKVILGYYPCKTFAPSTYFIIKSRFLTAEQMHSYLKDIRQRSQLATIIIIGKDINYEELFKNHYRVFGVIDTSDKFSLRDIRKQINDCLDAIYSTN